MPLTCVTAGVVRDEALWDRNITNAARIKNPGLIPVRHVRNILENEVTYPPASPSIFLTLSSMLRASTGVRLFTSSFLSSSHIGSTWLRGGLLPGASWHGASGEPMRFAIFICPLNVFPQIATA